MLDLICLLFGHDLLIQSVVIDQVLEPGTRVTVAMGTERNLDSGKKLTLLQIYCHHQ